ncbi:hypothetical protein ABZP36_033444 [Zizania latifolia]
MPVEIAHLRESLEDVVTVWRKLDHPNITKFIGTSMGTTNLMIPLSDDDGATSSSGSTRNNGDMPPPDRTCCVMVKFLAGGTLKSHLINHMDSKLPYNERPDMAEVVRLLEALDTNKGGGMLLDNRKMSGCFCLFMRRRGP